MIRILHVRDGSIDIRRTAPNGHYSEGTYPVTGKRAKRLNEALQRVGATPLVCCNNDGEAWLAASAYKLEVQP